MADRVSTQRHAPSSHRPGGLAEAYQQYRLELRRFFALNSRDPHAIDDLMQAMYLQLIKNRTSSEIQDPQQYLFRMAWNTLHTANRRARQERGHTLACEIEGFDTHADRSNSLWVEDDTASALQEDELARALAELPRACQVAVLRQYRDNRSYKEIAEELGVTTHAVKKYIMRALNHLRMHFNSLERRRRERDGS